MIDSLFLLPAGKDHPTIECGSAPVASPAGFNAHGVGGFFNDVAKTNVLVVHESLGGERGKVVLLVLGESRLVNSNSFRSWC